MSFSASLYDRYRSEHLACQSSTSINELRDKIRGSWSLEERVVRACKAYSRRHSMLLSILIFGDCRAM
jgi:hypothetical protein